MVQTPEQQSVPTLHTSPVCWQNDEGWHVPFVQSPEQHGVVPHGLPCVLHVVLNVAHLPLVHVPLQHCASVVHAVPSALHAG
jgi:hypothetical protein